MNRSLFEVLKSVGAFRPMGRGRGKGGKAQKGKAQSMSRGHSDAARQHAQEINAKRRADGKDTRSTASISRSLRRAQEHHAAKAKAQVAPEPARARSRSPARTAKAKAAPESSSYYEETDAEPPQPSAPAAAGELLPASGKATVKEPRAEPSQPSVLPKAGETLPAQKKAKPEEPRVAEEENRPAKGEPLPKAEHADEGQASGSQAGTGEALPVTSSTPKAKTEPAKAEQAEEVPALQGTPLSTGARMWTPSQFPQTLKLIKDLRTGEMLPVEAQLTKLGYGRTRAVYVLPAEVHQSFPQDSVLKLCMLRQHHGKEFEWGLHSSLVAPTYDKGQVSVDLGVQARYVHYSVQKRATMTTAWLAQFGSNVLRTHDLALYLLASLLALELRGAVLRDVGP